MVIKRNTALIGYAHCSTHPSNTNKPRPTTNAFACSIFLYSHYGSSQKGIVNDQKQIQ